MKRIALLALLPLLAAALLPVATLGAQQLPSQAAIQAAMATPGGADLIRQKLQQSGLTADQVRAKLTAAGYSPTLLDAYLSNAGTPGNEPAPTQEHLAALQALGVQTAAATPAPAIDTTLPPSNVFGVNVFRRGGQPFPQLTAGPVPPDYRLGPGDQVVLILTGDVELNYTLSITAEGFVLIPQVGQVYLANLTLAQARELMATRLGRVYSGVRRNGTGTTNFDLVVGNVRALQVYVLGEVRTPGAYPMSALGTMVTALYLAGGPTDDADMRSVVVRRLGKEAAHFDLYDYVLHGDTRSDIRLENNDVVFVGGRTHRVKLSGAVRHEAMFDLLPTETLADLVRLAGGLNANAALTRVSISRILPATDRGGAGPQRITIDVPIAAGTATLPTMALEDADEVTIFALTDAEKNSVDIAGSVYFPGKFGLVPGLRLSTLVARAGGLLPATYDGRAHISRLNPTDQTHRIIAVVLPADSAAPWTDDPILEDKDAVTIYNRLPMRPDRTITIDGAVNEPKSVPFRDGMTLRDLVLAANGLAAGASLDTAEISHLPTDRTNGVLSTTERVPLDSTYIFDRDSLGRAFLPPGRAFKASGTRDITLRPWDHVLILRQPDFEYQRTVVISGEIRYPGVYSLRRKDERLADLVARAGGLADRAYPGGVQFRRGSGSVGRIDVDLPDALRHPRSPNNMILQPGDTVIIPEYQPSVRVGGGVNSPGSVLWHAGRSLSDYVNAAGGFAQNADAAHASVRQANGQIQTRKGGFLFFHGSQPVPGPGSEISVPVVPPEAYHDHTALFAAIASIIASTATIMIAVVRLN